MQTVVKDLETRMQAAVDLLAREFSGVRTGRANTALLDTVRIEAYGALTPVNQMASVSVPDPKTLVIQPWDTSQIPAIEKALLKSDLGLTPSNDGKVIRLTMPALTEERRKELVKVARKNGEECKIAIRKARHEAKDMLSTIESDGEASQDDVERASKKLEDLVQHAAQTEHFRAVGAFQPTLEHRALRNGRVHHAGQLHVDAIDRLARGRVRDVQARRRLADQLPVLRLLERHLLGRGQLRCG